MVYNIVKQLHIIRRNKLGPREISVLRRYGLFFLSIDKLVDFN